MKEEEIITLFDKAKVCYSSGEYKTAIHYFTQLIVDANKIYIERNPHGDRLAQYHEYRALSSLALEDYYSAIADTKAFPSKAVARFIYGVFYLVSGKYHQAVDEFSEAISADFDQSKYYFWRGKAFFLQKEYGKAIQDLNEAILLSLELYKFNLEKAVEKEGTQLVNYFEYRAKVYYAGKNLFEALNDAKLWVKFDPSEEGHQMLAEIYADLDNFTEAWWNFTLALRLCQQVPSPFLLHLRRAEMAFKLESFASASEDASKSLELSEKADWADFKDALYAYKGRIYYILGRCCENDRLSAAINHLKNACLIDSKNDIYHFHLANLYQRAKMLEEAVASYTKALLLNVKETYYVERAECYYQLGKYRKSVDDFTRLLKLHPHNNLYYYKRAKAYEKLGKSEKANKDRQIYRGQYKVMLFADDERMKIRLETESDLSFRDQASFNK